MQNGQSDNSSPQSRRTIGRIWKSPLARLVLIILMLECLVFQWPAFVRMPVGGPVDIPITHLAIEGFTRGALWPQRLTAVGSGAHRVTVTLSGMSVRSVFLDVSSNGSGPVAYQVSFKTRESTHFTDLASGQAASGVERSRYLLLRPDEPVDAIRLTFDVAEGEQLHLNRFILNRKIPYQPNQLRILLMLVIGGFILALTRTSFFKQKAHPENIRQRVMILMVGFVLFATSMWMTTAAATLPFFNVSQHDGDLYNKDLSDALIKGQFDLLIRPDRSLLAIDNPYDPASRTALPSEAVLWDAALFDGRYHVSYGVLPAALIMAPFKALSGYYFQTPWAVFLFGALALMFLLKNLRRFLFIHFPDLSFRYHVVLGLVMPTLSYVGWAFSRPKFYEVTLLGGFLLLMLGLDQLMVAAYGRLGRPGRSLFREAILATREEDVTNPMSTKPLVTPPLPLDSDRDRIRTAHLFLAVLFTAAAIGCDPAYAAFLLPLAFVLGMLARRAVRTGQLAELIVFSLAAFLLAAVPLGLYNHARFGDWLVFGDRYRLTVSDLTARPFISPERILPGLGQYLINPPLITAKFPFIHFAAGRIIPDHAFLAIDGRTVGLLTLPFIAILIVLPLVVQAIRTASRTLRQIFWGSLSIALAMVVAISMHIGSLTREAILFSTWFAVPAMIVWLLLANETENSQDESHFRVFLAVSLVTLFLCAMIFLQGENDRIERMTPLFYEQLRRTMSVWLP